MNTMTIALFGKLRIESSEQVALHLEPRRAEELLCYLLLYRDRLHEREKIATLFWPDAPPGYAKRYLRQTLWQLQSVLNHTTQPEAHLLHVTYEQVGINQQADYRLDVAQFERTFAAVADMPGKAFCAEQADQVRAAVQLYQGDLLEGWYQDWCIYERERFQSMYMALLDKLLTYSEAHEEYEAGVAYGAQILRYDRAREQTHRQLMHLHYLAGDRSAAIHQYENCVAALRDELDVPPAKSTITLYKAICTEQLNESTPIFTSVTTAVPTTTTVKPVIAVDPALVMFILPVPLAVNPVVVVIFTTVPVLVTLILLVPN
jgi:DNA-binding SARP family transcriptional activator